MTDREGARMPAWAGEHEEVDAPLPDGRARIYYRWPVPPDAPDATRERGAAEAAGSRPWTPEAGPADSDGDG